MPIFFIKMPPRNTPTIEKISSLNAFKNPLSIISFLLKCISKGVDISISFTENVFAWLFSVEKKIFIKARNKKKLYKKIKSNKKIKYALTHNYSAYPMVRQAKQLVEKFPNLKPHYEYFQWLEDEKKEGRLVRKGDNFSINHVKLKEWL